MRRLSLAIFLVTGVLSWPASASASEHFCKDVDANWSWFGDHVASNISYFIVGSPGRKYEVGTGIFARGRPWGSRNSYSGQADVTAYGIGAIHIRKSDDGSPFKVCVTTAKLETVTIISSEF